MSEMLEKAVQAAEEAGTLLSHVGPEVWYEHVVRAALRAIRDPDDAMVQAGESGYSEYHKATDTYLDPQPAQVFAAMIDEVLK